MSRHVVVDGSNLATEGRSLPSLKQLNEAVMAFLEDYPASIITVVVDATFGHRIDPREVAEFDEAVENNELVSPPAGAIGRGDAFVLMIAKKAKAMILSNDSFQEFHGEHEWLFDDGRLMGGKPVPNVGWVFVPRAPVRGMISRRATRVAKKDPKVSTSRSLTPAVSSLQPMPIPKTPPPGRRARSEEAAEVALAASGSVENVAVVEAPVVAPVADAVRPPTAPKGNPTNDVLSFLSFVEKHAVGSTVEAAFVTYSSHGAYAVTADGVHVYVPMRAMAKPAPRSARDLVSLGDTRPLVVVSFNAARRGIDAAFVGMEPANLVSALPVVEPKVRKAGTRRKTDVVQPDAASSEVGGIIDAVPVIAALVTSIVPAGGPKRRSSTKAAPVSRGVAPASEIETVDASGPRASTRTKRARAVAATVPIEEPVSVQARARRSKKAADEAVASLEVADGSESSGPTLKRPRTASATTPASPKAATVKPTTAKRAAAMTEPATLDAVMAAPAERTAAIAEPARRDAVMAAPAKPATAKPRAAKPRTAKQASGQPSQTTPDSIPESKAAEPSIPFEAQVPQTVAAIAASPAVDETSKTSASPARTGAKSAKTTKATPAAAKPASARKGAKAATQPAEPIDPSDPVTKPTARRKPTKS